MLASDLMGPSKIVCRIGDYQVRLEEVWPTVLSEASDQRSLNVEATIEPVQFRRSFFQNLIEDNLMKEKRVDSHKL